MPDKHHFELEPTPSDRVPPRRRQILALGGIITMCIAVAVGYVVVAAQSDPAEGRVPAAEGAAINMVENEPNLLFLDDDGDTYRRLSVAAVPTVSAEDSTDDRVITDVRCQRFYMASDRGLCVEADPFGGNALILDADLAVLHEIPVSGLPSRARVSPDGRLGSLTVFVTGHSYAEGGFSTATVLIDMESGEELGNLEDFTIYDENANEITAPDFNFWGVTFAADSNRFYATLATAGETYLLEGDVAGRTAVVLRDNVECPSLSPDGTRIAFKKRIDSGVLGNVSWQLHLLDLSTMEERPLGDDRSVDDQVEWLDNDRLIYAVRDDGPPATIRPDLWVLPIDGTPELVILGGSSPTVVAAG